jgi:hypothetical protein
VSGAITTVVVGSGSAAVSGGRIAIVEPSMTSALARSSVVDVEARAVVAADSGSRSAHAASSSDTTNDAARRCVCLLRAG